MGELRVFKVERITVRERSGERTLGYFIRPGSRSRPNILFELDEVPSFEGLHAWFECERARGRWRVVQEVVAP
jgi:hypothetical protein